MKKKTLCAALAGALLLSCLAGCDGGKQDASKDFSEVELTVAGYRDLRTDPYNSSYSIGADKFMEKYPGSKVTFQVNGKTGGDENLVAAVNSGDVWDVQLMVGVSMPGIFEQNLYTPLDEYIDVNNPLYTKELMQEGASYLGKIYGVGNVMMSDFYYGAYNETMFQDYGIKTPAEYYAEGNWNRESFLKMLDDLKRNQVNVTVNLDKPSTTGTYAVEHNDDGTVALAYDKIPNRDWLSFIKNIVYDKQVANIKGAKGSVAQREIGFKQDILPHVLIDAKNSSSSDQIRYIPFVSKENPISTYIVEYYFGVPNGAKNPEASVELINHMIEACTEDRTNMYKDNMLPEDFDIFKKSAVDSYYIVRDAGVWPETNVPEYFKNGGSPATLIAENVDRMQTIVDTYNQKIAEQKAKQ